MDEQKLVYDVIVIGAGHAGCEAALASARRGASTLLVTMNLDHLAQMSCNPAIGGVAKGHLVREIDALGGAMGRIADAATLQFRMLNLSKGPAVWSPRSQCDKGTYQQAMKHFCEEQAHLDLLQSEVVSFLVRNQKIMAVKTPFQTLYAKSFVLCSGTFLKGKLHYGMNHFSGGRAGDPASELSTSLAEQLNLQLGRLKTGTPPRLLAKSIDFSKMNAVGSDDAEDYFSFFEHDKVQPCTHKHLPCYSVRTNEKTAQIVRDNIQFAPMYAGKIEGIGARYCPSFEDKVIRFPHHESHLLHLEPEGEFTGEYYINGISTSLPPEVQQSLLHTIDGLESCIITRYAYAIEYDFVLPHQINRSLQVKSVENLFLAGQINGTSGYEEAAGQGLLAGLNASRYAHAEPLVELGRETSYLGVMIDDLVTKQIVEPYRLFTSRAEYRLRLRQDNANMRLCDFAYENGLLSDVDYDSFCDYKKRLMLLLERAKILDFEGKTIWNILRDLQGIYPDETLPWVQALFENGIIEKRLLNHLLIEAHYEHYLLKEEQHIHKLQQLEKWKIPQDFNYDQIKGLKNESRQKLQKVCPTTLAQAARIDGVTPPEVNLLQVFINRIFQSEEKRIRQTFNQQQREAHENDESPS